jgi:hypothetical protein
VGDHTHQMALFVYMAPSAIGARRQARLKPVLSETGVVEVRRPHDSQRSRASHGNAALPEACMGDERRGAVYLACP